ncbi:MAG: zinc ribbon domain-containing protein [Betaproteobacteria bacterium]|nr:zinc ribbon domain-containing protein [Betaproteobacteria bacterium]MDE2047598.1 zinc ribbon domain-containing protein [Betaproteobacteria bacterium]
MPIYAYKCDSCGHAQDVLQKLSDPLLTVCPACGQAAFKKQVTAAGFQLKGSGWYATDFKGTAPAPAKPEATPAADAKPAESKPADGKASEAKPADAKPAPSAPPAAAAPGTAGS